MNPRIYVIITLLLVEIHLFQNSGQLSFLLLLRIFWFRMQYLSSIKI